MSVTTKEDLTDKMRQIVDAYWKLYDEMDERPNNVQVANEAYPSCSNSMVRYTQQRYPEHFDGERRQEQISVTILSLMRGDTLEEGQYLLSYNDDREGKWWLRFRTDDTYHIFGFDRVDMLGDGAYGLLRDESYLVTVDGLRDHSPTIARVLDLVAQE